MSLFSELKRRNVFRVGAAYIIVAWLIIQVAETLFPLFGFGDRPARIVVIVLAIGFVPVLIISWAFELTPDGRKRIISPGPRSIELTRDDIDGAIRWINDFREHGVPA